MWKKIAASFLVLTLLFSTLAPLMDDADARRYRSPTRTFTPEAPKQAAPRTDRADSGAANRQSTADSVNQSRAGTPAQTAGRTQQGFGGGSFLQGLALGGLAGLLFGGMLSGLGAFGSLLGLFVNALAIGLIVIFALRLFQAFTDRDRPRGDHW